MARMRLRKFEEELQAAIEGGMNTYSGHITWNFVNAVWYCLDVSTTIGKKIVAEVLSNFTKGTKQYVVKELIKTNLLNLI